MKVKIILKELKRIKKKKRKMQKKYYKIIVNQKETVKIKIKWRKKR